MAKLADIERPLAALLKDLPKGEAELEKWLAEQIAAAEQEGDEENALIARFGKSAATSTTFAWRALMQEIAMRVRSQRLLKALTTGDLTKMHGMVMSSVGALSAMKRQAERGEMDATDDPESARNRVADRLRARGDYADKTSDSQARRYAEVTQEGLPVDATN